jgi:CO/xanthine dehydrogenase FAD-binding subunit
LKPFDLVTVDTIEEALRILAENLPDAVPVAGGTDLLVRMKQNLVSPRLLVDLSKITELNRIEMVDEGLLIGSMVTHAQIASSDLIRNHAPAVVASSSSVGSAQTRQLGTIGGNLVSCVPSLDSAPPLLVLNAFLTVANVGGRRRIPIETFFVAPRCSLLTPNELLVSILIPREELGKASSFQKIGRRKALSLSLVNAAACVEIDKETRRFHRTRLALGAVAPTPIRARMAETYLNGKEVGAAAIEEAGRIAAGEASPIDDFRSSAQYRSALIEVLTRRVISEALSKEVAL